MAGKPPPGFGYEPDLQLLVEMFGAQVDPEVIKLVWQQAGCCGSTALDALVNVESHLPPSAVSVLSSVARGDRVLVLMRGASGSGKSTLAKRLVGGGGGAVLSTDDFFVDPGGGGVYVFEPRELPRAHEWNQRRAAQATQRGLNPVVIDNTNLEAWEVRPYVQTALRYDYRVMLVEPLTPWREDARLLARKNRHGVPEERIRRQLEKQRLVLDVALLVDECRRQRGPRRPPPTQPQLEPQSPGRNRPPVEWSVEQRVVDHVEAAVQTCNADSAAGVRTLEACSRDINAFAFKGRAVANRTMSNKVTHDKGSLTDEVVDVVDGDGGRPGARLAKLRRCFPTADGQALADILHQCQDDLNWATNLLLDSGYQWAPPEGEGEGEEPVGEDEEKSAPEAAEAPPPPPMVEEAAAAAFAKEEEKEEEMAEVGADAATDAADAAAATVGPLEAPDAEPEALRKYVEDCFRLTDTISDQVRRISGKDYPQFRASQLQKLRHPPPAEAQPQPPPPSILATLLEAANEPEASDDEEAPAEAEAVAAFVPFRMDPAFGRHLAALFGDPHPLQGGEDQAEVITFDIPWTLAEQIYLHWVSNVLDRQPEPASAWTTTPSSSAPSPTTATTAAPSAWAEGPAASGRAVHQNAGPEPQELRRIMDFELAMELAHQERKAERRMRRESLATRLSMQQLRSAFADVDPLALDALFEENDYNYEHTVNILLASQKTASAGAHQQLQGAANPPATPATSVRPPPPLPPACPPKESQDLRSEAFLYNKLRRDYQAKAQENFQRGMAAVAAYYASESRRFGQLYKETNQKAALQIVAEKNSSGDEGTIDLHQLKVVEALAVLESFIVENVRDGRQVIQVITGKGNHSFDGRPCIKPAVATFLSRKKYWYEEVNAGCFRVYLRRPMNSTR